MYINKTKRIKCNLTPRRPHPDISIWYQFKSCRTCHSHRTNNNPPCRFVVASAKHITIISIKHEKWFCVCVCAVAFWTFVTICVAFPLSYLYIYFTLYRCAYKLLVEKTAWFKWQLNFVKFIVSLRKNKESFFSILID